MEKIINKENASKNISYFRLLGVYYSKKYEKNLSKFIDISMDIAMISAPLITYMFQIIKFYKTKSSKGFSKFICLLFFLGNIFRIFLWLGKHFKNVLLYQSIGIIIFQIILIHLCIKFQDESYNNPQKYLPVVKNINDTPKNIEIDIDNNNIETNNDNNNIDNNNTIENVIDNNNIDTNINNIESIIDNKNSNSIKTIIFEYFSKIFNKKLFWNWAEEKEYYIFMAILAILLSFLYSIFNNYHIFFDIIGILSAIFESSICIPQIISNFRSKFTKNLSFTMICCWFFGDCFRLYYNIKYVAPVQLIIGISVQVFFDSVILFQLIIYNKNDSKEKEDKDINKKQIEEINQLMKSIDELNLGK